MDKPSAHLPHNPKVDAIIADITQLMNEAEQMLSESTSHHAEPQVELLRSNLEADSVSESFSHLCVNAQRVMIDRARRADRAIREKPYQAMAIALGVGVLFGLALKKRAA